MAYEYACTHIYRSDGIRQELWLDAQNILNQFEYSLAYNVRFSRLEPLNEYKHFITEIMWSISNCHIQDKYFVVPKGLL